MTSPTPDAPRLHAVPNPTPAETPAKALPRKAWWTAAELMTTDFPEPRWAVPGVFAEGVSLLCGPPKVGKSWLSLGLGLTVAAGGKAFGTIPVQAGPVLYLALEDTARRLKERITTLLNGRPVPEHMHLLTDCLPMDQGGAGIITGWLDAHPDARMIVIDVLTKIRSEAVQGATAYQADYAAISPLMDIAQKYAIAIVVVHHVRKQGSDDFLATVSGTNGLAGAADATYVLVRGRGQADGVLHMTGRDVGEAEHALTFSPDDGSWTMLPGPASDHTTTDTRAAILRHLRDHPGSGATAIARASGLEKSNVRKTCQRMFADGLLIVDGASRYSLPPAGAAETDVPRVLPVPLLPLTWENVGDMMGDMRGDPLPGLAPEPEAD
ncbi:AAA family ATPase [Longispora sp. K20-0274]|uniref:AAA family ATPase n=1 Tax=Longispora sp. K20-0274 TaxID=3088255 RepID=UPI00399C44E6